MTALTPAQQHVLRAGADWLRRTARRFLHEADRLDPPPAPARRKGPEPLRTVPRKEAAALLIRKSDRRGGWTYRLHHGAQLLGDDDRAFKAQEITAYGIDAATRDAGLDAAIAVVFGPDAVPKPVRTVLPILPVPNRPKAPA